MYDSRTLLAHMTIKYYLYKLPAHCILQYMRKFVPRKEDNLPTRQTCKWSWEEIVYLLILSVKCIFAIVLINLYVNYKYFNL